jgi:hypothetical protein
MTIEESKVRDGTLVLGSEFFSCEPTSVLIASEYNEEGDPVEVLCGEGLAADTTVNKSLNITAIQDFNNPEGLMRFLRDNELRTVPFMWKANQEGAQVANGQIQCRLGDWGGEVNTRLTTDLELPIVGTVSWTDPPAATGATAGIPGWWTPTGANPPADLAALQASAVVASPATAWTVGQYVILVNRTKAYWDGAAWKAGTAPTAAP